MTGPGPAPRGTAEGGADPRQPSSSAVERRPTVLAVDADRSIVDSLGVRLQGAYEFIGVTTGSRALETLAARDVDVVLADAATAAGRETLRRIARVAPGLPIVALSDRDRTPGGAAMPGGAAACVGKPVAADALHDAVRAVLGTRSPALAGRARPDAAGVVVTLGADLGVLATVKGLLDRRIPVRIAASTRHALESMADVAPSLMVIDASPPPSRWRPLLQALPPRLRTCPVTIAVRQATTSSPPEWDGVRGECSVLAYHRVHELADHIATAVCERPIRPSLAYSPHVLEALDFMARHYARTLTLRMLATAAGISSRQLGHLFRADMGTSVMEHLKTLRIEVAKCLLWDGTPRLEDLAERVGFSDSSHLSRVFLERVGVRPGQYHRVIVSRLGLEGAATPRRPR